MALKRKLELDTDELSPINTKQLKLFPFPNSDTDSLMMDAEPSTHYHTRLLSDVSSTSSNASDSPLATSPYPSFNFNPLPFLDNTGSVNPDSHNFSHYVAQSQRSPSVGLLQPSNSFTHHG
ncbi:hypothetical protein AX16_001880 [Volvariella volvacea WC 439]|nr:hypothetical protein AX16_001880 [Volvariella volvacea WC 439]